MNTDELLKKVKKIEIKSRGLSRDIFAGQYHSAFKGRGMAFSEVREYQMGDDVRDIDWNVTARFDHPYIKVFEEERELSVMLLVDASGSLQFGTRHQQKRDMAIELAATLAISAIQNNDKIGVIFFTDKIEKYIPPKKGRTHAMRIIRELVDFHADSKQTDIAQALEFFSRVSKRRSTVFLMSDFICEKNFSKQFQMVGAKHDFIALQLLDCETEQLPDLGLLHLEDIESGKHILIDTGSRQVRESLYREQLSYQQQIEMLFAKTKTDSVQIKTTDDYIRALQYLFRKRGKRQ